MGFPNTIAIDGPAASGKSTIAEKLAADLNYLFFDTGVMYRAVTYAAMQRLGDLSDEAAVTHLANEVVIDVQPCSHADGRKCDVILDGVDVTWLIRLPEVEANVSQISAYGGVRKSLVEQQRRIGLRGRIVMVGRDIGTVVLPDADLKVYLDATVEERARRRYQEVKEWGDLSTYAEILANLRMRDQIDSTRAVSPLRPAEDAVVILTDGLSIDEVVERVKALFKA